MAPEKLQVVLADHQEGKTTHLVRWLLGGHLTDAWPGWSRLLLCHNSRSLLRVDEQFEDVDRELIERGVPGGLSKLLTGPSDLGRHFTALQDRNPDLEIAVDNVEFWLEKGLGIPLRISLISMTGEYVKPGEAL